MAYLLSFSRRSLSSKWFCSQTLRPLLILNHIKDYTEPNSSSSNVFVRRFHNKHVFLKDRTQMSFVPQVVSGILLCRHMSSSSDVSPEKTIEAMNTKVSIVEECTTRIESFSLPEDCVQYVNTRIQELTGFNWWISIVLTAFLVNGLMSPISLRIFRHHWELSLMALAIIEAKRLIKICDPKDLAMYQNAEIKLMKEFGVVCLCTLNFVLLDGFVYFGFIHEISVMAKKIPEFENGGILWFTNLSTPESFYMLPLLTGFIFWFTGEINKRKRNLPYNIKRLPWFPAFFMLFQVVFEFESAVYLYLIPTRICISTLLALRKPLPRSLFVPFKRP